MPFYLFEKDEQIDFDKFSIKFFRFRISDLYGEIIDAYKYNRGLYRIFKY
jgi:hypothetical protein